MDYDIYEDEPSTAMQARIDEAIHRWENELEACFAGLQDSVFISVSAS